MSAIALSLCVVTRAAAGSPDAHEDYLLHCSGCHGPDGRGTPGVVPSLHGVGALAALPGGRDYLVRVPGVAQAPLSDARLARLLDWVLERWSNVRPSFTVAEVARARKDPLRDPVASRPTLEMD